MHNGSHSYQPSLEGVRALAFLLVFAVHFSGPEWTLEGRPYHDYPWLLACQLSFAAVPVFFALSGYLITGVLLDTRDKSGYFRVFYLRRALRVLPLYYLTLAGVYLYTLGTGTHLLKRHLLLLTYFFNFWPANGYYNMAPYLKVGHFWSLAVEEQFYLAWPLVIWLIPNRAKLVRFAWGIVVLAFLARLLWPLLHLSAPEFVYQNTLFRGDAIMLGAILALYQRQPGADLVRLRRPAALVLMGSSIVLVVRALCVGHAMPFDTFGVTLVLPLLSFMGAACVVLSLIPGTWIFRGSTWPWAVALGKRTYGLYLFHQLFVPYFLERVIPRFSTALGRGAGRIAAMLLAFALTWLLAELGYRLVELPAIRWKKRIPYGQTVREKLTSWSALPFPGAAVAPSRPTEC